MEEERDFLLKPPTPSSSLSTTKKHSKQNDSTNSSSAVPDFIQKLFRMLENKAFKDVFCWDPSGTTFLVKDTNEFSKSILPKHFKHCNFASFVRQLNKYDFHKIRSNNNADEGQKIYGDQTWEFEHSHFKRDRKDLLEEIKRKTPGKKKRQASNTTTPVTTADNKQQTPSPILTDLSITANSSNSHNNINNNAAIEELKKLTKKLQSQVNQLKQSQNELEATVNKMDQTDKLIMAELSGFQESLKKKDEIIRECLKLTVRSRQHQPDEADQNVKVEDIKNLPIVSTPSNNWSEEEQAAIPIESILTDLFLPSTAPSSSTAADNTASVAAAAAQLNGGSLIGSSIKTPDGGLTFLALGRLASNTNAVSVKTEIIPNNNIQQVMNSNNQQQQQQDNHVVTSETGATQADNKGKKKMVASWTTPPRVLLVDDDSVYRDVSGRMLNMIGCSIDLAKDGLEALQKMSVEKYDLILMDIVMPKMDGIATTRNIRRYDSFTPIVSMTSNFTHNDIMEYIGIGMNDILPKPFSKNTLYDILEKHCAHLKIIHQQRQQENQQPVIIPRGLAGNLPPQQQANITSMLIDEAASSSNATNYPYNTTTTTTTNTTATSSASIVDTPSTSSTTSSPTNNSPTITTPSNTISSGNDSNYWKPIDNRKLVWSSSASSVQQQPKYHHHPSPHHHQQNHNNNKRQKLNDLYDTTPPY